MYELELYATNIYMNYMNIAYGAKREIKCA